MNDDSVDERGDRNLVEVLGIVIGCVIFMIGIVFAIGILLQLAGALK